MTIKINNCEVCNSRAHILIVWDCLITNKFEVDLFSLTNEFEVGLFSLTNEFEVDLFSLTNEFVVFTMLFMIGGKVHAL